MFFLKMTVIFHNFIAATLQVSLVTFRTISHYFKSPQATQFSRDILSNVFDHSFHISVVFQTRPFVLFFSLMSRMKHVYMYRIKIINKTPISKRFHSCHVNCQHAT